MRLTSKSLSRRLERLEDELAPPSDEPVFTLEVEFIGSSKPNKIIELRGADPMRTKRPRPAYAGRIR